MSARKKSLWLVSIVLLVLIIDQSIKFWIKTHLVIGESIHVFSWFQLLFVENNGMAFGMELIGKLFLSLFRVGAIIAIIFFLRQIIKKGYRLGFIICIGLVLAGAIGNLIDSAFYGMVFTHSYGQIATFLNHPEGAPGYSSFLHGRVVDMFYFPIIKNAQGETIFFSPVFNFADSSVTVGVALILLLFRNDLNKSMETKSKKGTEVKDEITK